MSQPDSPHSAQLEARLLTTLEELLQQPALRLREALTAAAHRLAEVLGCEKVDAFIFDESKQSLVALGTSRTPMGVRQQALGLDILPLANGGWAVHTFRTGKAHLVGNAEEDGEELTGIVRDLGVRSEINAPLLVSDRRRGVLSAVSAKVNFFTPDDLRFLQVVSGWVGSLVQRAELIDQIRETESKNARRAAADELVMVLAHDLKNHIHPLLGRLHLLKLKLEAGQGTSAQDLDAALRSAERMSRLTSEMLDVARLDQGLFSLRLETVDVAELARDVGGYCGTTRVGIEVKAPEELKLIGDPDRLRQALENVVANAVKHSPVGVPVRLDVSPDPEDVSYVRIVVADSGSGISPELLPRLFERFSSGGAAAGLGLGLHLAREIARAHHGSLTLDPHPGEGARFCFRLPRG
ncbi:MAG TPA: GAF domain-containing sensor histidine kinase [Polyangiaceae bacterium]|nr:GAF domain-containing sensor histidine kinase [Polyangiaceae bacterium]